MKVFSALAIGALLLAGCSGKQQAASSDPYAGLSDEILKWKTELAASDVSCKQAPAGQKCSMFEVSCKGSRPVAADEQAKGVTAKVVTDLTWSGFDDKGRDQTAGAAALFTRQNGAWTRSPAKPVNPETCADL
jgi:hypothetical protein